MKVVEKSQQRTAKVMETDHPQQLQERDGISAVNGNPMTNTLHSNAHDLTLELEWLAELLQVRLQLLLGESCSYNHILEVEPPPVNGSSLYADFLRHYEPDFGERLALLLALSPHIQPVLLQRFFKKLEDCEGTPENLHQNYCPTGEALAFILADDLEERFILGTLFNSDHLFSMHNILSLEPPEEGITRLSGLLKIAAEYIDYFTTGIRSLPDFGPDFPARHITTKLEWEDLVLPETTVKQLEEIQLWMTHGHTLLHDWELSKKVRPGHRALFYGPPGTGKSMTACLLAKSCGKPVYKIDLSLIVSKYIGETTKNLAKVFDQAEKRDWILFFDEADALFGKRTKIENAHDRYANQEVAYLLQRIEYYEGVVLLASNLKDNLDQAFARRFESVIHFPMPNAAQRLRLWKQGFSPVSTLENNIALDKIAAAHELSGGAIMNVVRHSSLMALKKNTTAIALSDIQEGIKKEFRKEGKTV